MTLWTCENCLDFVSPTDPHYILHLHVTSWLRWESFEENADFFEEISDSFFFTKQLVVDFWNLAALRRPLLNRGWRSLTSEMKIFAKFCLKILVVLCLICEDFATCSLALHKHVVIDVVKRWSTFASLALSILAPIVVPPFPPSIVLSVWFVVNHLCFSSH